MGCGSSSIAEVYVPNTEPAPSKVNITAKDNTLNQAASVPLALITPTHIVEPSKPAIEQGIVSDSQPIHHLESVVHVSVHVASANANSASSVPSLTISRAVSSLQMPDSTFDPVLLDVSGVSSIYDVDIHRCAVGLMDQQHMAIFQLLANLQSLVIPSTTDVIVDEDCRPNATSTVLIQETLDSLLQFLRLHGSTEYSLCCDLVASRIPTDSDPTTAFTSIETQRLQMADVLCCVALRTHTIKLKPTKKVIVAAVLDIQSAFTQHVVAHARPIFITLVPDSNRIDFNGRIKEMPVVVVVDSVAEEETVLVACDDPIPLSFKSTWWQKSLYGSGIGIVDQQHAALFQFCTNLDHLAQKIARIDEIHSTLGALDNYCVYHFASETALFAEHSDGASPEATIAAACSADHHTVFINDLRQRSADFRAAPSRLSLESLSSWLLQWLRQHIVQDSRPALASLIGERRVDVDGHLLPDQTAVEVGPKKKGKSAKRFSVIHGFSNTLKDVLAANAI